MIVKMNKVTVFCLASDREATLEALRELGVLHIAHVQAPRGLDLERARGELAEAKDAAFALSRYVGKQASPPALPSPEFSSPALPSPAASSPALPSPASPALSTLASSSPALPSPASTRALPLPAASTRALPSPAVPSLPLPAPDQSLPGQVLELVRRKAAVTEQLELLQAERVLAEPYGDFDPETVGALRDKGVSVRLFKADKKAQVVEPAGTVLLQLGSDTVYRYYAVVGRGDFEVDATETDVPGRALRHVVADIDRLKKELDQVERSLVAYAFRLNEIQTIISRNTDVVEYAEARFGMGESGKICYLQGYCPEKEVEGIRKAAGTNGWGVIIDTPAADENVPTLLDNPAWIRPINAVFSTINILPGYAEADVSVAFLFFLSLFFAMIVGDAGYGLVFLVVTWLARFKAPKAPKEPFQLMTIFSVTTIVWGMMSGVYFGVVNIPPFLEIFRINWLGDNLHVMYLCLIISAVHLTCAHAWVMIRTLNSPQALAQLGWIAVTWTIFFLARQMIVNIPMPSWFAAMAVPGLLAVVLFMTPLKKLKTEWVNHLMLPLNLMSNFGDVLSYLRLFALSMAGVKLAGAFNTMAFSLGFDNVLAGFGAVVILAAGHALNITLCAVSVLVHGIRLNALEFSMHFGLEWRGFPYRPFGARKEI